MVPEAESWQPKPGRTACVVPFCRRTTKRLGAGHEHICGKHWKAVSRNNKKRKRSAERIAKRARERWKAKMAEQGGTFTWAQRRKVIAANRLADAAWERCKREAIEAAMGIG